MVSTLRVTVIGVLLAAAAHAQVASISGRVLDASGAGVSGADVAELWMLENGGLAPVVSYKTGKDGAFTAKVSFPASGAVALMAMDSARKRGGVLLINGAEVENPITIRLEKLVSVRGSFRTAGLEAGPEAYQLDVMAGAGVMLATAEWTKKDFSLALPAGRYTLRASADGAEPVEQEIELVPSKPSVQLDPFTLKGSGGRPRRSGSSLPGWNVTDARGVDKNVKLSDFKGKWVIMEFWGFW
jgi:hypothetical protein